MSLTKTIDRVLVSASTAGSPAVAASYWRIFMAPPPKGWRIRTDKRYGELVPVASWGERPPPPGAEFYYQDVESGGFITRQLGGYIIPGEAYEFPEDFWSWPQYESTYDTTGPWQSAPGGITYVTFPDVPVSPNGYPYPDTPFNGPVQGYFDIPTITGTERIWRTYARAAYRTPWVPQGVVDPPYCYTRSPYRACLFSGFPGRAEVPGTAAVYENELYAGWNSGADSVDALDADCRTVFQPVLAGAVVCGFFAVRANSGDYAALTHAFYFDLGNRWTIMESGRLLGVSGTFDSADEFEIERVSGVVTYKINGVAVYTSTALSGGAVQVGASLYLGGDGIA